MALAGEVLETPENGSGGILVILPGWCLPPGEAGRRSCLADNSARRGEVLERFFSWFDLWGLPLIRRRGQETGFERAFALAPWPAVRPPGHGPQTVPVIAARIPDLLPVLARRRPRLLIFLSCYLWRAIETPEWAAATDPLLGPRLDHGRRLSDGRLAAFLQRRREATVLALPLPGRNTTAAVVSAFGTGAQLAFAASGWLPAGSLDPRWRQVADQLVLDRERSLARVGAALGLSPERAERLWDRLEGVIWRRGADGLPEPIAIAADDPPKRC